MCDFLFFFFYIVIHSSYWMRKQITSNNTHATNVSYVHVNCKTYIANGFVDIVIVMSVRARTKQLPFNKIFSHNSFKRFGARSFAVLTKVANLKSHKRAARATCWCDVNDFMPKYCRRIALCTEHDFCVYSAVRKLIDLSLQFWQTLTSAYIMVFRIGTRPVHSNSISFDHISILSSRNLSGECVWRKLLSQNKFVSLFMMFNPFIGSNQ